MSKQSPQPVAEEDDRLERDIVALLSNHGPTGLWSIGEVRQALGGALVITDALDRLHKAGVIHRCGEFVLITRAAARSLQLAEF
jgi:hypothetical protein